MTIKGSESFQSFCARIVARQREDVRQTFTAATDYAGGNLELSGTGLRNLVEWMEEQPSGGSIKVFFDSGIEDAVRALRAIDEHALAIEVLLRNGGVFGAAGSTLLRGAMEGVLGLCYLFDSSVPPAQMAARLVAHRIASLHGNEKAIKAFGTDVPQSTLTNAQEASDGIKQLYRDSGFILGESKDGGRYTPSVSIDGETAQVKVTMTEAAKKYAPDDTFGWAIASGAVHSEAWFLPSFVNGASDVALGHPDEANMTIVSTLLAASESLAQAIGKHTGYDVGPFEKRTFTRQKTLISRLKGTPFSPIDFETYKSRGKSKTQPAESVIGESFMKPGTTYGPMWDRPKR